MVELTINQNKLNTGVARLNKYTNYVQMHGHFINNYWMRFCDIQNNQGRGRGYQPKPKAEADSPY